MGVTGLWQHLKPAAVEKTFEQIALEIFDEAYVDWQEHGQGIDAGRLLGLRVRPWQGHFAAHKPLQQSDAVAHNVTHTHIATRSA
jgi:hypothetical protein